MTLRALRFPITLSFVLAAFLSFGAAIGLAQSLGDIARQERARQRSVTSAATYTNETLKTNSVVPQNPAAPAEPLQPAAAAPVLPSVPSVLTDDNGHDEKWWRDAFSPARADLQRAEDLVRVIQIKLNQAHHDFLTRSDIYNREARLGAEIKSLNLELEAAQKQVEKVSGEIARLQENLRRAGGFPGWAR